MTDEAKKARRAYHREWARKNPDKIRRAHERYWEKRAKILREEEQKVNGEKEENI